MPEISHTRWPRKIFTGGRNFHQSPENLKPHAPGGQGHSLFFVLASALTRILGTQLNTCWSKLNNNLFLTFFFFLEVEETELEADEEIEGEESEVQEVPGALEAAKETKGSLPEESEAPEGPETEFDSG